MRRQIFWQCAVIGLAYVLGLVGVAALRVVAYREVHPHGQTLREHLAAMPAPVDYRLIERNGTEYLAVRGPMPPTLAFASGPPVYVFDRAGMRTDYTHDSGDDPEFHRRWPGVYHGKQMDRTETENWVAPNP
ncbi:hypothetical protein R5W23_002307 [Gemmata sp. JC673]|uniref:Uncharacterized protein n=1 Tax=Gemmata algarum TaxID=2975278 RepID=A0ABU5F0F4_9BACT|nr:hypothetical protein [Gemmata algarum]MDY3561048.1 hypothetical protein [Gemmata algarum]